MGRHDSGRLVGAGRRVHDGDTRAAEEAAALPADLTAVERAVVVDEVLEVRRVLDRLVHRAGDGREPVRLGTQLLGGTRKADGENVGLEAAREGGAVESRGAPGILRPPPLLDGVHVGRDLRSERPARIRSVCRVGVHDTDLVAGDRGWSISRRRRAAPRCRVRRRGRAERQCQRRQPGAAHTHAPEPREPAPISPPLHPL